MNLALLAQQPISLSVDVSGLLIGFTCMLEIWSFSFCFVLDILILLKSPQNDMYV